MRRPLVGVALCYVGGILLANHLPVPLPEVLLGGCVLLAVTVAWERGRPYLIAPLLVLTGAINLTFQTAVLSPRDLRALVGESPTQGDFRGRLVETPYHRVYEHDETRSFRTIAFVDVHGIRLPKSAWQPAAGRIAVATPGILSNTFWGGQEVEINGVLRLPDGPAAPGLFDYRHHLRRQGIYYVLRVESTNDWRRLSSASQPPLADRFGVWAKAALARGLPEEDEPLRLLWAMTLGWKTALTGEVSEPFMRSGTMHVFAISGLHIALIAGILVSVLRVVRMPRGACGLIVIPLIWLYTGVTGWQASAIRSTIMMTVIIAGWSLRRPNDLLNSLAAAACLILLWDPQQLFQASFQLSFFVVLSLALFSPALQRLGRRLWQFDPLKPDELRPRWQLLARDGLRWLVTALVTSLAAWLGSIPLIACYFHLFTPVSLLANLLVVPLSTFALASNMASLAVAGWFPGCAELFNHAAWFFMRLMIDLSQWAAAVPGGWWYVRDPSLLGIALYYAVLVSVLAGWLQRPKLRGWVGAGLILLAGVGTGLWVAGRQQARLTILPLNGGDAVFVEAPGNHGRLLIDCGDESSADFILKPFLRARGMNRLPALLLTHGDARHMGGAVHVQREFRVQHVRLSPARFRSPNYRQAVAEFEKMPDLIQPLQRGDRLGAWTVLHPEDQEAFAQADDEAVVLLGSFHGTRILVMSDLGKPGQNRLLQREPNLSADIVVAGLPAQTEPLAEELIKAINPRVIIITDSEFPATARASPELRRRLSQVGVPVLYTRKTGALTVSIGRRGWTVLGMTGAQVTGKTEVR